MDDGRMRLFLTSQVQAHPSRTYLIDKGLVSAAQSLLAKDMSLEDIGTTLDQYSAARK
jgi:hypothetical protein